MVAVSRVRAPALGSFLYVRWARRPASFRSPSSPLGQLGLVASPFGRLRLGIGRQENSRVNLPPQLRGLRLSDRSFEAERGELFEKHRPGQSPGLISVRLLGRGLPNVRHTIMLVLQRRLGTPTRRLRSSEIGSSRAIL